MLGLAFLFFHSANLSLLAGEFILFTFKIYWQIMTMYILSLFVSFYLFVFVFSSLRSWLYLHSLSCKVSSETAAVSLIGCSVFVTCCFSPTVSRFPSLSSVLDSLSTVCLGDYLFWLSLFGIWWTSCSLMPISLSKLGQFSIITSFSRFSEMFLNLFLQESLWYECSVS